MSSPEGERDSWCTPNPPDVGRIESDPQVVESSEPEQIRRITYDDEEETELTAGLPEDFSGREEDATRWILALKEYFVINRDTYDEEAQTLVTLNKMNAGSGATFAEGWYLRLANNEIPLDQRTFKKLNEDFH